MAVNIYDLTTVAAVTALTGAAAADADIIQTLITAASVWANNYTSRILKQQTFTEYYDGDGTELLFLKNYPIEEITTIHQDSDRVFGTDTLVDSDNYVVYADNRSLVGDGVSWEKGIQTIKIVYVAGFDTVPYDLVNAITELVDYWYLAYSAHRFGVTSTGTDTNRIVYEKGIPLQIKKMLTSYVKKVVL